MNGIPFELLFVLLFIVASVMDAVGRSAKKRRRIEEMEVEEAAEDRPPVAAEPQTGRGSPTAERETADSMIPPDLWSILTGQSELPAPPPQEKRSRRVPPATLPEAPPEGEPLEWGRKTENRPALSREEMGLRNLPEPMAGRSAEAIPERSRAGRGSPAGREQTAPTRWTPRMRGEAGAEGLPEEGGSVFRRPPLRAPAMHAAPLQRAGAKAIPSPYAALLRSNRPESLREAIVLTEILGPPVTLRPPGASPWEMR